MKDRTVSGAPGLGAIFFGAFADLFRSRAKARRALGNPNLHHRASPFRFEALESRLLLSADLVGSTFDSEHDLVLRDDDGTDVTFELRGAGNGTVIVDGGSWDVVLSNTTAHTSFSVKARGGDDRVALDDIRVAGSIEGIDAPEVHLTGTLAIDGTLGAGLLIGSASDALIAAPSLGLNFFGFNLGGIIVLGDLEDTEVLIGANLGADGQLGGTGSAADTFGPGSITLLAVLGSVTDSVLRAGQDPVNGIFDDCDDVIQGGADSCIGFVLIGGELNDDSRIIAGRLPAWALVDGRLISTAGDPRFKTDVHGADVELALANDTGASATDGLTFDPSIAGSVSDAGGIVALRAGFGGTANVDILDELAADGSFVLSRSDLEEIYGAPLADGSYTLTIEAFDGQGNACPHSVSFTLDSTSPTVTINQAPDQQDPASNGPILFTVEFSEAVSGFSAADVSFAGSTAGGDLVAEVTGIGTTYTVSVTGMTVSAPGMVVVSIPGAAAADAAGNASAESTSTDNSVTFSSNQAPVAADDSYSTNEDTVLTVAMPGVQANDTDIDLDALTTVLESGPSHGSLTLNADGSFTYTPAANFNGSDSFIYRVSDGALTDVGLVSITVNAVNDAPVAQDDSYTVDEDAVLTVDMPGVLGNDTDVDSDALTAVLEIGPAHGSLVFNADGSFSYTPEANFNGTDSFAYVVFDGDQTDPGQVSITVNPVNDAPVAADDSYSTDEDTPLTIVMPGVLANDTDMDLDALTTALVSGPSHGNLTLNADGSFAYTPEANFNGSDSFTYRVSDGGLTDTGEVTITVNAVNDAPAAGVDSYSVDEDAVLTVAMPGVLGNDTDVDSDALTAVLEIGPAHGSLLFNADSSFTYTPEANFNGSDSFAYRVSDGTLTNVGLVSIVVNAVNDAPVAADDSYSTDEDTPLTIVMPGVLANDTDIDLDALTTALESGPAHGNLTLNADGSFTYTPEANFNGSDSFTYRVSDGDLSDVGLVSITVNAVNDAPAAGDDSYSVDEDAVLTVLMPGVLGNDTDIDSAALTATLETGPAHGTLVFNADGTFSYTPNANFNGSDSFTYRVSDGDRSDIGQVSITVNAVNDAPVAANDFFVDRPGNAVLVTFAQLLGNDTDADGDALSVVGVLGLAVDRNGNVVANVITNPVTRTISVVPRPGFFTGEASFFYTVRDGFGGFAAAQVTIDYRNVAPVAGEDLLFSRPGESQWITFEQLLDDDTDADGDARRVVSVGSEVRDSAGNVVAEVVEVNFELGWLVVAPTAEFASFIGAGSFSYRITDDFGGFDDGEVTLTYLNNEAPVTGEHFFEFRAGQAEVVITFAQLLESDTDPDGNALRVVSVGRQVMDVMGNVVATVEVDFELGQLVVTRTAEFASFTGAGRFSYRITDDLGGFDDGEVTLTFLDPEPSSAPAPLDSQQLQSIVDAGIAQWASTLGLDSAAVEALSAMPLVIADLPDGNLAFTDGMTICIDIDAAGRGWFVDATPLVNEEYEAAGNGVWTALASSPADGTMDLFTVVMHELGRVLGFDAESGWTVMQDTLAPGQRYTIDWNAHPDASFTSPFMVNRSTGVEFREFLTIG